MEDLRNVELSSAENTAYWWTRVIRGKVREIVISGAHNKSESEFANIFINFSEKNYRKLYLELSNLINEDISNFVSDSNTCGPDLFSQDTKEGQHNRLIEEISQIVKKKVPDICLSGNGSKDSVIYTSMSSASVWYKSCGLSKLPTKYEANYILTGDEKELKFYNTLLSTILILKEQDSSFDSTQQLKQNFCVEYAKNNDLDKLEPVINMFDKLFNIASDRNIIFGRSFQKTYSSTFRETDYAGLEEYMDIANHYANTILENCKIGSKKSHVKSLIKSI